MNLSDKITKTAADTSSVASIQSYKRQIQQALVDIFGKKNKSTSGASILTIECIIQLTIGEIVEKNKTASDTSSVASIQT